MIRIVKVNGLRTPEQRSTVCYVGRAFAGWPESPWGNPFRIHQGFDAVSAVAAFREWFSDGRESLLQRLWVNCEHGSKPLGCWCIESTYGDGQPVVCHAQVLAELLHKRFVESTS